MKLIRKTHSCVLLSAAVFAVLLCPRPAAAASHKDMLDLIPDDCWGFFMIPSLDAIDAKAAMLKKILGLEIPDQVADTALAMLNVGDTIDRGSPICAVMMNVTKFGGMHKSAVLLVTTKDAKELLEHLEADDPVEGVSKCLIMGEPAYAAVRDKIVIVGPDMDCVTKVSKTKKTVGSSVSKTRLAVVEKSDVYLSISLSSVVDAYKEFLPMAQMMMSATDPEGKQVGRIFKMLTEISALDIALTLDDDGFALRMLVNPLDDSDFQKLVADEKSTTDSLLAGLPKENYLLAMGSTAHYSEYASKFQSETPLSDMLKFSGLEGIDDEALKRLDKEFLKLQKSLTRYAVCVAALPEGADGMLGLTLIAETDGARSFIDSVRNAYDTAWKISEDEDVASVKEALVHKADAETIDGHQVDTITVDILKLSELDDDEDEVEPEYVEAIIGKECVLRFGAVDDKRVVFTFGGGKGRFETVAKALKSSGDALSSDKGISTMAGRLPSPRSSEVYLAVDSVLQTIRRAMTAVGQGDDFPIEVPTLNVPICFSTTAQDKIMRIDVLVPMELIKAGKSVYDKYASSVADDDFDELDDDDYYDDDDDDYDDDE